MLVAVVVHPEHREVFPPAPEPIQNTDGATKNDCEREAAKRLIADVRREHPHLNLIVLEDGLASNAPHIRKLRERGMRLILGAKPGDYKGVFDELESNARVQHWESTDGDGTHHRFRVLEQVALNKTNKDVEVNVLEYWETKRNGKRQRFSWVTDLPVNREIAMNLMRAGRARRRIETETFNTLKNQGYNLELDFLKCKAERAGILFVDVPPAGTSQDCSRRGTKVPGAVKSDSPVRRVRPRTGPSR